MAQTKYVRMLETCEDTNMFDVTEDGFGRAYSGEYAPAKNKGKRWLSPEKRDKLLAVSRTDQLEKGRSYELPSKQADKLVDLEYAELIQ